jgi:hypothetical protein
MALMPLAAQATRLLGRTLRVEFINKAVEEELSRRGSTILAFWHGQLFFFAYYYRDRAIPVMMSRSRDGEAVARVTRSLGFLPVRGSSSRGGSEAFRALVRYLRQGRPTGITPDGPRGPRGRVQPGVIHLAQVSGVPILPASFAASPRVVFRSWDRFVLPLPFSRVVVAYGEPLEVGPAVDEKECCLALEERLHSLSRQAEAACRR